MAEKVVSDSLCRDCLSVIEAAPKCQKCKSPRVLTHPELFSLTIAHLDCDAFFASVEKRDDPSLKAKPLIVGGTGGRGVVSTCCYLARMRGVHSAMPMYRAKKLCPEAVVIKPNMAKYKKAGGQIREMMQAVTPLVEPLSIDEAFMDLSGTERVHHAAPAMTLAKLALAIEKQVGITVSIGLAPNKFLAKLSSDMQKPRGFTVVGKAEMLDVLAALPVGDMWGVGKAMEKKLARDGITEVSQLQTMDEKILAKRYGELGLRLYRLSRGIDHRKVSPRSITKSISAERTLDKDLWSEEKLIERLWPLCGEVSDGLKKQGFAARTITLKLKNQNHKSFTRSRSLDNPTQLADVLFEVSEKLLKPMTDGTYYRLIGIGASNLTDPIDADPPDLIEPERTRRAVTEHIMDGLRDRFGKQAIQKGRGVKNKKPPKSESDG